jgi:hypothetical protein
MKPKAKAIFGSVSLTLLLMMVLGDEYGVSAVAVIGVLGTVLTVGLLFLDSDWNPDDSRVVEVPPGYSKMIIRYGVWEGEPWPQNHTAIVELAPAAYPGVIVTFKPPNGGTDLLHLHAADVRTVDVYGDGRSYFGFGFEGAVSASLASAVDRMFAPWDLRVTGPAGEFHLHSYKGPIPGPVVLGRVEQRLAEHRWSDEY